MQIRELIVEHFRGVQRLEWRPESAVVCLFGPGDSTKTTILDAIELVLGSRWAVSICDMDFHVGRTDEPIVITATVGQLPVALMKDEKYGLDLRGWSQTEGLHDEPQPGDEGVLSVRFFVDDSLEPEWLVINDRKPDGRHIPARDREHFGVVRLGGDVDRHLSWGRGSALTRNTDDLEEVSRVVAAAHREARQAISRSPLLKLKAAASRAQAAAMQMGVRVVTEYRPGLEAATIAVSAGQLSLHDGDIPIRASGLASRRLSALALQGLAVEAGAILLVDEVEHALEPHRLRHLLHQLQAAPGSTGQVFLTTHSPIPLEELSSTSLYVTRSDGRNTRAERVSADLQSLVRSNAEALLGRRVIVCEGPTEIGLCRGLRTAWAALHASIPLSHTGTTLADGGGSQTTQRAIGIAQLGFPTAILIDSDTEFEPAVDRLPDEIAIFQWQDGLSTEERITRDLQLPDLQRVVDLAIVLTSDQSVVDSIKAHSAGPAGVGRGLQEWIDAGTRETDVRAAVGKAAKKSKWFKSISRAERLGEVLAPMLLRIPSTDLAVTLTILADWAYDQ